MSYRDLYGLDKEVLNEVSLERSELWEPRLNLVLIFHDLFNASNGGGVLCLPEFPHSSLLQELSWGWLELGGLP